MKAAFKHPMNGVAQAGKDGNLVGFDWHSHTGPFSTIMFRLMVIGDYVLSTAPA